MTTTSSSSSSDPSMDFGFGVMAGASATTESVGPRGLKERGLKSSTSAGPDWTAAASLHGGSVEGAAVATAVSATEAWHLPRAMSPGARRRQANEAMEVRGGREDGGRGGWRSGESFSSDCPMCRVATVL